MIDRQKPYYSKDKADMLYQNGLMPEYIYRQLYFTAKENFLYYRSKQQQKINEMLNQRNTERVIEEQIDETIERKVDEEVSKMIEDIFGQSKK